MSEKKWTPGSWVVSARARAALAKARVNDV